MKIDEAIKLLQQDIDDGYFESESPVEDAAKLGIEAMKREQHRRKYDIHLPIELFLGETEE